MIIPVLALLSHSAPSKASAKAFAEPAIFNANLEPLPVLCVDMKHHREATSIPNLEPL